MPTDATSKSPNRTSIYEWDTPTRDLSRYQWYNPVLWLIFAVEIAVIIRWYWWHKRQSWKAKRVSMHTDLAFGLQSCRFLLRADDVPDHEKAEVEKIKNHLENVADELNLESDHLEKYRGAEGGDRR